MATFFEEKKCIEQFNCQEHCSVTGIYKYCASIQCSGVIIIDQNDFFRLVKFNMLNVDINRDCSITVLLPH